MLQYRIIPTLLLSNGGLVKTRKFKDEVYIGDPINTIRIFNEKEVDELVVLDIRASVNNSEPQFEILEEIASECFSPLSYGGGITNIEHIYKLFRIGFEKVIINTAFFENPIFVKQACEIFGSQAITVSIDVKSKYFNRNVVLTECGTKKTRYDAVTAAVKAQDIGVGEILLTSIDFEGTRNGYDLDVIAEVARSVEIPVIASGGAGKLDDFKTVAQRCEITAMAAGSMFVFYGPHNGVLISYPEHDELTRLFYGDL